jgi:hypothetical protein
MCQVCSDGSCVLSAPVTTCYQDLDGDGFGNPAVASVNCGSCPAGFTDNNMDCCDRDGTANPAQLDFFDTLDACNSWDYDCSAMAEPQPNQVGPSNCGDVTVACELNLAADTCIATCTASNASVNPACEGACNVYTLPPCGTPISVDIKFCIGFNAGGTPFCQPGGAGNGPLANQRCH